MVRNMHCIFLFWPILKNLVQNFILFCYVQLYFCFPYVFQGVVLLTTSIFSEAVPDPDVDVDEVDTDFLAILIAVSGRSFDASYFLI